MQPSAGRVPREFGGQRCRAQLLQQRTIFVNHGDMPLKSGNVANLMNQGIPHVRAYRTGSFRTKQGTAAAACLSRHQCAAFLDAGLNQNIALSHQFRHVVPMSQHLHAGMGEHARQLLPVSRQKFSGDQEGALFRRRRTKPGFQCKVHALPNGTDTDEEHGQPRFGGPELVAGVVDRLVEAVHMPRQPAQLKSAIQERPRDEMGGSATPKR